MRFGKSILHTVGQGLYHVLNVLILFFPLLLTVSVVSLIIFWVWIMMFASQFN